MNPEDAIKFEKMMANARDTWGANYQALLRVARAAKEYLESQDYTSPIGDKECAVLWDALKELPEGLID